MTDQINKKKILIIGGGRRGLASIEVLSENENIDILALVDINSQASGVKLAQRLGITTDTEWEKYFDDNNPPAAVLNLTGDENIQKKLYEKCEGKNVEVLGEITLSFLSSILMERQVMAELHRVSQRITSNIGLEELMVLILSSCVKSTKAEGGIIVLYEEANNTWEIKSNWGIPENTAKLLLDCATHRLPVWPSTDEALPLVEKGIKKQKLADIKNSYCAPLKIRGNVKGALIILNNDPSKKFSSHSVRLLSTFANQSSVAIENILLYTKSKHLSVTDGLTGVYNHRFFQENLETELARAQRYDLNFALIIIDLDNFKQINDTYGHLQGDEILRKVSAFIDNALRGSDTVSRYGGDEFAILLPETKKEDAVVVAERIRKGFSDIKVQGEIEIRASIGIAAYPDDGVFGDDLIAKADEALYKAKEEGRNKTCVA